MIIRIRVWSGKGILLSCTVFFLITLLSLELQAGPRKASETVKEGTMSADQEIMAVLSCWGYGYTVKVFVNGVDVGIVGGKSENRRLFDKDNEMAALAAPEMRKKNFMLVNGDNTISVEFKKESPNTDEALELSLAMENYPAPLFKMVTKKPLGKVERTITIRNKVPAGFKTVTVAD